MPNRAPFMDVELTKNDAKCSDVMTALKPTTGTNAANNVPKTTCIAKDIRLSITLISLLHVRHPSPKGQSLPTSSQTSFNLQTTHIRQVEFRQAVK